MAEKNTKEVILGAVIGTVLGSLSAILLPPQQKVYGRVKEETKNWAKKAKALSENIYNDVAHFGQSRENDKSKTFVAGAVLGAVLGAGSAMFLTPRSGKQLRKQVVDKYQDVAKNTQSFLDYLSDRTAQEDLVKAVKKKISKRVPRKLANVTKRKNARSKKKESSELETST